VQVTRGGVLLEGEPLGAGDGAAVSDRAQIELEGSKACELLLFDLA
jgi:hypothetical protein